ncbi:MAG: hypothetical protein A2219_08185 [Elusimicrobia bacterium RIFOXYA2_FULL_50_26]|nr:MAG: hypothetical protein A2219_08185 [Elusimicrobia bacterium RIFOXYA2_FULL_50_26]
MKTIGLIAGNGRFPFLVAEEIRRQGDRVAIVGLEGETDPSLEKYGDSFRMIPLGKLQKIIDFLHEAHADVAIMAGQVKHSKLFSNLALDWRAVKLLGSLVNKKTDSILGAVAQELKKEGIELLASHTYLERLLPKPGILAGPKLSGEEKADIKFGHNIAKEIAGLDIGQSVVVKDRAVVAVESMEGTDECIRRAATLAGKDFIVVKVAKPGQDWRFDIPVVGIRTIDTLIETKARALAIDAGSTLFLDKDEALKKADDNGITVIAIKDTI